MERKTEQKKLILLIVLFVIVAGGLSRPFLKRRRFSPPPSPQEVPSSPRQMLPVGKIRQLQEERMKEEWGRNPFLAIGREKGDAYLLGLSLAGILWDETRPLAIINDVVVGVGDVIEGYFILNISPDTILLEKDGKEYTLRVGAER